MFFFVLKKKITFIEIKKIIIISLLILVVISFDTENRPDSYLYHLPYSQILNENKIILGVSNLHFRFGHVSILQYLSSFNYTYFSGLNGLLVPSALFASAVFLYFFNDLLLLLKNKKISYGKLFSLFIFLYICLRINRYGEFGNDAMGHLTVFYLISKFIYIKDYKFENYKNILFLSVFAILNKSFLIFTVIIPLYMSIKQKINFTKVIINLPTLLFTLWLIKNLLVSGCAIYPLKISCFKTLKWVNIEEVSKEALKAEAWSKGWPDRKEQEITQEKFVKNFQWFDAWQKKQKSDFIKNLIPYSTLILIFLIIVRGKNNIDKINIQKKITLLIFSITGSAYFILNFPLYRYGYSYLVVMIIIFCFGIINKINYEKFLKSSKLLIIFCVIGVSLKQIYRVYEFNEVRNMIPKDKFLEMKFQAQITKINISENFYYFKSASVCKYYKAPCTHIKLDKLYHKKIAGYDLILNSL